MQHLIVILEDPLPVFGFTISKATNTDMEII
jgi:hypothetical protein